MISSQQVKQLRDKTGVSVMQCRQALESAGGNLAQAEIILQQQSRSVAQKKSDRRLGAGTIQSYIHAQGAIGAMLELACESDFVAKNEEFRELARVLAMQVAAADPQYLRAEDIPPTELEKMKAVWRKEISGQTPELREKILQGKLEAYLAERILLNQPFIKDQQLTVGQLVQSAVQKFGEKIEIVRFARFAVS